MKDNMKTGAILSGDKTIKIVVLLPRPDSDDEFWTLPRKGVEQIAGTFSEAKVDLNVLLFVSEEDFAEKSKQALSLKPDGVILAPIYQNRSQEFSIDLDLAEIPYVYIDSKVASTNPLCYVGEDPYQSGRIAASVVDLGLPGDQDILMVNIGAAQHLNARNQGFLSFFMDGARNSGLKVAVNSPVIEPEALEKKLNQAFKKMNVGAIWTSNSKGHMVADYLVKNGRTDTLLVTYDAIDENVKRMHKGIINVILAPKPTEQGRCAMRILLNYLLHDIKPSVDEFQKIEIVNNETFRYFKD